MNIVHVGLLTGPFLSDNCLGYI